MLWEAETEGSPTLAQRGQSSNLARPCLESFLKSTGLYLSVQALGSSPSTKETKQNARENLEGKNFLAPTPNMGEFHAATGGPQIASILSGPVRSCR